MTAEVRLTKGKVALIDAADWAEVSKLGWQAVNIDNAWYAQHGYRQNGVQRTILMHRFITKAAAADLVDHRNHDGLDNRRNNLRTCTTSQNQQNARKRPNTSSAFKGVYWEPDRRRWRARLKLPNHRLELGRFLTEHEAAAAYDTAARQHFGEFACLNLS